MQHALALKKMQENTLKLHVFKHLM